jgi:hypothetical protein
MDRIDGWMEGNMVRWIHRWTDQQTWMDAWINVDEWIGG